MTRTIKAGEFKAKCLKLIDEVAATGEDIVITKRGKVVARVTRAVGKAQPPRKSIYGMFKGQLELVDPDDNLSAWDEAAQETFDARQDRLAVSLGRTPIRKGPA